MEKEQKVVPLTITLNGTDKNHWKELWGLKQNPFPQIARCELDGHMRAVNSLDGDPLTGPDDIRKRLQGFSDEFIDICIKMYKPGESVKFVINVPKEFTE